MKSYIKINKKVVTILFVVAVIFSLKPLNASAEVIQTNTGGIETLTIKINNVNYAAAAKGDQYVCSSNTQINGFCTDIAVCGNDNILDGCHISVAKVYDKKMTDILQAQIDAQISAAGLDKDKANTAIKDCGGDLSCINKILTVLQKDSTYAQGSSSGSSANDPLTAASLSDLINSNMASQTKDSGPINSAANDPSSLLGKTQGPKVDVVFNSSGAAQAGSKMSATAVPSFFNNASDPKKLYFTWYLKRKGCGLTNSAEPGDVGTCDMDGDGKITENDWKIAAAKIIVAKSFDRISADYTKFPSGIDENSAGYKAVPSPLGEWSINSGADENAKDAPNCYVQAPKSGRIYELRKTKSNFDNECPSGYHRACVSNQTAKCSVFDSLTSQKITNDFGACTVSSEKNDNSDVFCSVKDDAALKNFKATVACNADNAISLCVKDDNSSPNDGFSLNTELKDATQNTLGVIVGTKFGTTAGVDDTLNNKMCSAVAKPDLVNSTAIDKLFLANTDPLITPANEDCSFVQGGLINGTKDSSGKVLVVGNASLAPKCSFEKAANLCKHLFPKVPGEVTGDGKFTLAEKQFWGADPTKASTNGIGKDEENAVGLGVDKFDWMFTPGDQVGVVVEGESAFPSDHQDASFQRMWAFSKGKCAALDRIEAGSSIDKNNPDKNTRGFYIDGSKGILTADVDLNDCLEENLLEPNAAGVANLTVQLNASPDNPVNDPNGKGDVLNIVSSALNTQDSGGLLYKWTIQKSLDGSSAPIDTTNWIDITKKTDKDYPGWGGYSFAAVGSDGLGKKELSMDLNFPEKMVNDGIADGKYTGTFYLKIKVNIKGTAADGSQDADGEVIVRVKQQQNEMLVYQASATDNGMLNLPVIDKASQELCADQQGKIRCYVIKNEILGLEIPESTGNNNKLKNFSWTVNGKAIACSESISSGCAPDGNKLFVPILGNVGEAVDVVAKAINEKNESIEVSRHFVIGNTQLQITSTENSPCSLQCLDTNNACPKYLGHYNDLNGNQYPDCSTQVWETNEGKTVTLGATGQTGFDWAIDGQILPEYKDQSQMQLVINKAAGESYNIGLSTSLLPDGKKQLNNLRKALYRNWGVAPEDAVEENQSANIQLDVVGVSSSALSAAKQSVFGASLITHLPEQLMFLLKISLTSILMLLATGLLFAFIPETLFKEEE